MNVLAPIKEERQFEDAVKLWELFTRCSLNLLEITVLAMLVVHTNNCDAKAITTLKSDLPENRDSIASLSSPQGVGRPVRSGCKPDTKVFV